MRRLDQIEARANAASPGPWFDHRTEAHGMTVQCAGGFVATMTPGPRADRPRGTEADAAFIAHARVDMPWLVGRVRALEQSLRSVEHEIETNTQVAEDDQSTGHENARRIIAAALAEG